MRLLALAFLFLLFSCKQSNKDLLPGFIRTMSPFEVTVAERSATRAIIKWTSSENLRNADVVRYKIMLNDQLIKNDALRYTDTLRQLKPDVTYNGKVIAYTQSGDTTSAPFTLERIDSYSIYSASYELHCVDLTYGRAAWADMNYNSEFNFTAIPVVVNDTVYMDLPGVGVAAYSLKSGEKLWLAKTLKSAGKGVIYRDQTLYTIGPNAIFALNSSNGATKWQYPYTNPDYFTFHTNTLLAENILITGGVYTLTGFNIDTKKMEWTYKSKSAMCVGPASYKGLVIITTLDGMVEALDIKTGAIVWKRDFSREYSNFGANWVSPLIVNDYVYVYSGNTGYYALNAKTGATVWNLEEYGAHSATYGDGLIYYSYSNAAVGNHVTAVNALTGKRVWDRKYIGAEYPIFADGKVYACGHVLDAKTGDFIKIIYDVYTFDALPIIINKGVAYYPAESGMNN
ncbi:PQQ-binding-like beta-propeller repeat protein [Chitinophaga niabensis]|uniref:outer membrane protein assembly factor BamB family protein n=1 Tax=Chitinophaga niabensis TaxID=536979 RepID=UPI0031B9E08C